MNKPSQNSLNQQKIPGWFPVMNPKKTIIVFFVLGCVYLLLGIIALISYNSLFFVEKYYGFDETSNDNLTYLRIPVDKDVQKPVYVHFTLTAFYQNHQRFVDGVDYSSFSPSSENRNSENALIGASKFNDSYDIMSGPSGESVVIDTSDLVFKADKNRKDFSEYNLNDSDIVWAKVAPFPTFRKLYGVVNEDLKKGEYLVRVKNNYRLPEMSKKAFVIQKASIAFGGRNIFVGVVLVATGGVMIILGVVCIIINFCTPRKLGHYHRKYGPDFADTRIIATASGEDFYILPSYLKTTDAAFYATQSDGEGGDAGDVGVFDGEAHSKDAAVTDEGASPDASLDASPSSSSSSSSSSSPPPRPCSSASLSSSAAKKSPVQDNESEGIFDPDDYSVHQGGDEAGTGADEARGVDTSKGQAAQAQKPSQDVDGEEENSEYEEYRLRENGKGRSLQPSSQNDYSEYGEEGGDGDHADRDQYKDTHAPLDYYDHSLATVGAHENTRGSAGAKRKTGASTSTSTSAGQSNDPLSTSNQGELSMRNSYNYSLSSLVPSVVSPPNYSYESSYQDEND